MKSAVDVSSSVLYRLTIRIRSDDTIRPNTNTLFAPLLGTEANTKRICATSLLERLSHNGKGVRHHVAASQDGVRSNPAARVPPPIITELKDRCSPRPTQRQTDWTVKSKRGKKCRVHTSALSLSTLDCELSRMTELRLDDVDGEPASSELSTEGSKPSQTEMTRSGPTDRSAFTAS